MKKLLSVVLVITMLFSLVACNKDKSDVEQEQNETKLTEWQVQYQQTLTELLQAGVEIAPVKIASAYISDTNADGIPLIALSMNTYAYEYPDIILNYVDGKVVELPLQIDDYGSSVSESICFMNGTDDIVIRSYGATTGTFGENEFQKIYSITESGEYALISDKGFALPEELSKEYTAMLATGANDIYDYQQNIFSQMDEEIERITGKAPSLIDYKTVSVSFMASSDDTEVDTEKALQYINEMLGTKLSMDNVGENSGDSIDNSQKGTFNAEKYVGSWGNVDADDDNYRIELYITEAENNKLTCEFSYIRLFGYGPDVIAVNDDGTADFKMRVGQWTYAGQMIFENEQIKVVLEKATSPYSEIIVETIVFERANYEDKIETETLPLPNETVDFVFSPGAGWGSTITLNKNGTFTGISSNPELGETGELYPQGSEYISEFSGAFENIERINEYSYRMTLASIKTKDAVGEERIENGTRYIAMEPMGVYGGKEFILYLPSTPINMVPTEFLTWWPNYNGENDIYTEKLGCYGILNVNDGSGYFYSE